VSFHNLTMLHIPV